MRVFYSGVELGLAGAFRYTWDRTLLLNKAQVGYGFQWRAVFPEITFLCSSQGECSIAMDIVSTVLAVQGGNLVVQQDDGLASANSVISNLTLSGVRCLRGPTWSDKPGGQFATWREYSCEFGWETALAGTGLLLMDFSETIVRSGGTQLLVLMEPINAGPLVQQTVPIQGYRTTQEGQAIGYQFRPNPYILSPPRWPAYLTNQTVTETSGERIGNAYKNFGVKWRYEYVSPIPLTGGPQEWVGP